MLKTIESLDMPAFVKNDNKNVVVKFRSNDEEPVRKSWKSKSQNLAKSQKLAKSGKKFVISWPRDLITWSYLLSSNDISLNLHPLTTLSLPTFHLILPLQNIALTRSAPARITSRHCNFNLTFSTSETIRELDYLTKLCNWGRHTKQNQPRMVLVRKT